MEENSPKIGDRVRTETGEVGKIVHIARLTVFVQLDSEPDDASLKAFLMSQLTKIDPPPVEPSPL
jgi:hypothetical protein